MEQKKMKLAKYISIAATTLVFFILSWILTSDSVVIDAGTSVVPAVAGIIMLLAFTFIAWSLLGFSIKQFIGSFKDFKSEKGLWKILNIVFKIGMFVFAVLIFIFWLVWFIYLLKWGTKTTAMFPSSTDFIDRFAFYSIGYISGWGGSAPIFGLSSTPFGLYVTSFVFILIWSGAGIGFEIIKKVLGGNRPKKEDKVEKSAN